MDNDTISASPLVRLMCGVERALYGAAELLAILTAFAHPDDDAGSDSFGQIDWSPLEPVAHIGRPRRPNESTVASPPDVMPATG